MCRYMCGAPEVSPLWLMKAPSLHANEAAVNPNQRGQPGRINPTFPWVPRRQWHNGPQVITQRHIGKGPVWGILAWCPHTAATFSCHFGQTQACTAVGSSASAASEYGPSLQNTYAAANRVTGNYSLSVAVLLVRLGGQARLSALCEPQDVTYQAAATISSISTVSACLSTCGLLCPSCHYLKAPGWLL